MGSHRHKSRNPPSNEAIKSKVQKTIPYARNKTQYLIVWENSSQEAATIAPASRCFVVLEEGSTFNMHATIPHKLNRVDMSRPRMRANLTQGTVDSSPSLHWHLRTRTRQPAVVGRHKPLQPMASRAPKSDFSRRSSGSNAQLLLLASVSSCSPRDQWEDAGVQLQRRK